MLFFLHHNTVKSCRLSSAKFCATLIRLESESPVVNLPQPVMMRLVCTIERCRIEMVLVFQGKSRTEKASV